MTIRNPIIKRYPAKYLFIGVLLITLLLSCSSEEPNENNIVSGDRTELSISFTPDKEKSLTRSVGTPDKSESRIFHLMVFIFNSSTGERDGFAEAVSQTGITEIKGISFTAGRRDVYVIANPTVTASNNLRSVQTLEDFKKIEKSYIGLYEQGGTVDGDPDTEGPIGGIEGDDNIKLTMVREEPGFLFDNTVENHKWGYGTGDVPKFELERLVARIAVQKITLDLSGKNLALENDGSLISAGNYSVRIENVFLLNVQDYISPFSSVKDFLLNMNTGTDMGIDLMHAFATQPDNVDFTSNTIGYLGGNLGNFSPYHHIPYVGREDILFASLNLGRDYDIQGADNPVWFYAFENYISESYPTTLIVTLRFNFRSALNPGIIKTALAYYPVVINGNGLANGADHNYIKPNNQYGLKITIKDLSPLYDRSNINPIVRKSIKAFDNDYIRIEESVGTDLFPWTGDTYKKEK